jgi:hypothetical protein
MEEQDVIVYAIRACAPNALPSDVEQLRNAVAALLSGQHAGAYGQCPDYGSSYDPCPAACASGVCASGEGAPLWVLRTWADVRAGDFVRPPGVEEATAEVLSIGPVLEWHVNDAQPLNDFQRRDIQYNPGRYAGAYSVRHVTMRGLNTEPMTRDMRPEAPVEIHTTAAELRAIELLGGWSARLDLPDN